MLTTFKGMGKKDMIIRIIGATALTHWTKHHNSNLMKIVTSRGYSERLVFPRLIRPVHSVTAWIYYYKIFNLYYILTTSFYRICFWWIFRICFWNNSFYRICFWKYVFFYKCNKSLRYDSLEIQWRLFLALSMIKSNLPYLLKLLYQNLHDNACSSSSLTVL